MHEELNMQGPATARFIASQEAEIARLKKQLRECEVRHSKDLEYQSTLMTELQHQVRNNLQVVVSMLTLQKRKQTADLEMIQSRIEALSSLYSKIELVNHHSEVDFGDYLLELATRALQFHDAAGKAIRLDIKCEHLFVNSTRATPLGLLTNEFVMNSIKHAFPERGGCITIRLHAIDDIRCELTAADDGIGFSHTDDNTVSHGLMIMKRLAMQAETDIVWEAVETGTKISVVFLYSPRT